MADINKNLIDNLDVCDWDFKYEGSQELKNYLNNAENFITNDEEQNYYIEYLDKVEKNSEGLLKVGKSRRMKYGSKLFVLTILGGFVPAALTTLLINYISSNKYSFSEIYGYMVIACLLWSTLTVSRNTIFDYLINEVDIKEVNNYIKIVNEKRKSLSLKNIK